MTSSLFYNIVIPKETREGEQRVAIVPEDVPFLKTFGSIWIEEGAGVSAGFKTQDYVKAGAKIINCGNGSSKEELLKLYDHSQLILRVKRPDREREKIENEIIPSQTLMIGFLDPLDDTTPHVNEWKERKIKTLSLDQLPFSSDDPRNVLAAMSRIAGKIALHEALSQHKNAKNVFVIGTGNVGLAAIQEAEQLKLNLTIASTNETFDPKGNQFLYLSPLTDHQTLLKKELVKADIVIATARRAKEKAPLLITKETLNNMQPGTVVVDLARTEGGNVEGSENDKTLTLGNNVIVTNQTGYPKLDPSNASKLFSGSLVKLVESLFKHNFEENFI